MIWFYSYYALKHLHPLKGFSLYIYIIIIFFFFLDIKISSLCHRLVVSAFFKTQVTLKTHISRMTSGCKFYFGSKGNLYFYVVVHYKSISTEETQP